MRECRTRFFLSLLLAGAAACAAARDARAAGAPAPARHFDVVDIEDGLSSYAAESIVQDRHGFIWIGADVGLNRYDGNEVLGQRHYARRSGPLHVTNLHLDSQGLLWIGTYGGGLARYDERSDSFRRYRHDPAATGTLASDSIFRISEGAANELWLCLDLGLNRLRMDDGLVRRDSADIAGLPAEVDAECRSLFRDGSSLWIGSRSSGIARVRLDTRSAEYFPVGASGLRAGSAVAFARHPRRGLIVALRGIGLDRLDEASGRFVPLTNAPGAGCNIQDLRLTSLAVARDGELWIGTRSGAAILDAAADRCLLERHDPSAPFGLPHDHVRDIHVDRTGIVWLATNAGLARHDPQTRIFAHYRRSAFEPTGLSSSDVSAMLEDSSGTLWLGTNGAGLNRFERRRQTITGVTLDSPAGTAHEVVTALADDGAGHVWVSTQQGVFRVRSADASARRIALPAPVDRTTISLLVDGGDIWLGTLSSGALRIDERGEVKARYPLDAGNPRGPPSRFVANIVRDADGRIWLGGNLGLSRYEPATDDFTNFRHLDHDANTLGSNVIVTLAAAADGALWVGTDSGVDRFDARTGRVRRLSSADGLAENETSCVLVDRLGIVWIGTIHGLSRLDPATWQIDNFFAADGLQGEEVTPGACAQDVDGMLYFAGTNGYTAFAPEARREPAPPPPVYITKLVVLSGSGAGDERAPAAAPIHLRSALELGYRDKIFGLGFAALDFANPRANRFAYRLIGVDERWTEVDAAQPFVTFAGLRAGNYRFEVQAANRDGVWNRQGAALDIKVRPAPWLSGSAYVLYAAATLALVVTLYRLRTRSMRLRASELERQVAERTRIIDEQHRAVREADGSRRRLVAAASHDLRTPLAAVQGYLETVVTRPEELSGPEKQACLDSALGATRRVTRLVNELFDLARVDDPDRRLEFESFNVGELAADISMEVSGIAKAHAVEVRADIPPQLPMVVGDIGLIERLIGNLLDNAIRHSPAGGEVVIAVRALADGIEVSVTDGGNGIPEDHLERIFEPFYRVPDATDGQDDLRTGLGLATARRIVLRHGGWIRARNQLAGGACITFLLPLHPPAG